MLRNFSRKAKRSPAAPALPEIQVQSLAHREYQRGIMTNAETRGAGCGSGDAGGRSGVIRAVIRAAFHPPEARASWISLEGRA
jgi:hypothetical protein